MTDEDVRQIAKATVEEMLQRLGADTAEPGKLQKDFAFLRSWRESTEAISRQGKITVTIVLITGLLGLIWLALKGHIS